MPHAEESSEFTPEQYPPFPEGLKTIDLDTISLYKIQNGDPAEQERLFEACKSWGFVYLDLRQSERGEAILHGVDDIARLAEKIMSLPMEEKMKYLYTGKDVFG